MYLFDLEDFNCDKLPSDWEDYAGTYREVISSYAKEFDKWYYTNKNNNISSECNNQIDELFDLWRNVFLYGTINKLQVLIDELIATESTPCDFDSTKYYDFLDAYNKMIKASDEITLLMTTGCKLENFKRDVGVDITSISGDKKITQCNGVYIQQIDNGSEFIGKITIPTIA